MKSNEDTDLAVAVTVRAVEDMDPLVVAAMDPVITMVQAAADTVAIAAVVDTVETAATLEDTLAVTADTAAIAAIVATAATVVMATVAIAAIVVMATAVVMATVVIAVTATVGTETPVTVSLASNLEANLVSLANNLEVNLVNRVSPVSLASNLAANQASPVNRGSLVNPDKPLVNLLAPPASAVATALVETAAPTALVALARLLPTLPKPARCSTAGTR